MGADMATTDGTIRLKAPASRLTIRVPRGWRLRLAIFGAIMRVAAWVAPMRTEVEWEVLRDE